MDFITKGEKDLSATEKLYGKNSEQYAAHNLLIDARTLLETTGTLTLGKLFKHEYITYTYDTCPDKNEVKVTKKHLDVNRIVKKSKTSIIERSIESLISNDLYDLMICRGYRISDYAGDEDNAK